MLKLCLWVVVGVLVIVLGSYILFGAHKELTDAKIRQKIVGVWIREDTNSEGTTTIASDGVFLSTSRSVMANSNITKTWIYEGTWQVKGGVFILTITKASGFHQHEAVGSVDNFKIVSLNDEELVCQVNNQTIVHKRKK